MTVSVPDIQIAFVLGSEVKRLETQEESCSLISCREEETGVKHGNLFY